MSAGDCDYCGGPGWWGVNRQNACKKCNPDGSKAYRPLTANSSSVSASSAPAPPAPVAPPSAGLKKTTSTASSSPDPTSPFAKKFTSGVTKISTGGPASTPKAAPPAPATTSTTSTYADTSKPASMGMRLGPAAAPATTTMTSASTEKPKTGFGRLGALSAKTTTPSTTTATTTTAAPPITKAPALSGSDFDLDALMADLNSVQPAPKKTATTTSTYASSSAPVATSSSSSSSATKPVVKSSGKYKILTEADGYKKWQLDPLIRAKDGKPGCSHHVSKAKLVYEECCKGIFPCMACHSATKGHYKKSQALYCTACCARVPWAQNCANCGTLFGEYYCARCQIIDQEEASVHHCIESCCILGTKEECKFCIRGYSSYQAAAVRTTCSRCNGTGRWASGINECGKCEGKGYIQGI